MDWLMGKNKKKEKEQTQPTEDVKPYLDLDYAQCWVECSNASEKGRPPMLLTVNVLRKLVELPHRVEHEEWMATHMVAFFNLTNYLCSVTSDNCNNDSCPVMTLPGNVPVYWFDEKGKKTKHSAPVYTSIVMSTIESLINDETVFPTKYGEEFGAGLDVAVRRISKLLLQVLLHLYHAHYMLLVNVKLHSQLNSLLAHLYSFSTVYNTIEDKDWEPILDLLTVWGVSRRSSSCSQETGSRQDSPSLYEHRSRDTSPAVTSLRVHSAASNSECSDT